MNDFLYMRMEKLNEVLKLVESFDLSYMLSWK